ncbi:DNA-binding CsgD family transcriptional regulator [Leucobacter exalbidus]|uniref:DNA-binding CsgD family transcriptional regulator n=1 Tax=Leucobacter exalbidus TaxID=662960 RepID=A0A940PVQ3_9MICO|nr:LuxR C-terminal-related transcriptional regulator [Leucobacter exalbidus]MBP1327110.1 DNA-binding CsgD family transcriptional regulator [Leucobacter exalbidus]
MNIELQRLGVTGSSPVTPQFPAARPPARRLAQVLEATREVGSLTLLLGERGNGRLFLATSAARILAAEEPQGDSRSGVNSVAVAASPVTVLPTPPTGASGVNSVFGNDFSIAATPQERANHILTSLASDALRPAMTLIAPDVDAYSPGDLQLLRLIISHPHAPRTIAIATGLSNEVESLMRGLGHTKLSVAPLDLQDADEYLSTLLGVQRIDHDTLARWHELARGTSYGLAALGLNAASSGRLQRNGGVAWVARGDDSVSGEFAEIHTSGCTDDERRMLEVIALAEPVTESSLLRSFDATVLARLFSLGFLSWRQHPDRQALVITHALLAESIRASLAPTRRFEIYDTVFDLLDADRHGLDPVHIPERLIRLVTVGLLADRDLPAAWLWNAFDLGVRRTNPHEALRLAVRVGAHPDLRPQQRAVALLEAARLASLIGDYDTEQLSGHAIVRLLNDTAQIDSIEPVVHAAMLVATIRLLVVPPVDTAAAIAELQAIESRFTDATPHAREVLRASRVYAHAGAGELRLASELDDDTPVSGDLALEWIRSSARGSMALILAQRGKTEQAASMSKRMHALTQLGPLARRDFVDFHAFGWVVSCCMGGRSDGATEVWEGLAFGPLTFASSESHHAGLLNAAQVIVSIQNGRWSDVAQQTHQLLQELQLADSFGLRPFVSAARGYALAVLGQREESLANLHLATIPVWGVSQMLTGLCRGYQLRAHSWLGEGDVGPMADELAAWAADEQLEYIELMALHIACYRRRTLPAEQLQRARTLAAGLESAQAAGVMAHIERLCQADPASATPIDDSLEVRLLAELGVWVPLPPAPGLTPREREVALFAALGRTSRFIAERLGISARTVETHLAHIFAKVGVQSREELCVWFERHPADLTAAVNGTVAGRRRGSKKLASPDAAPKPLKRR